MSTLIYGNLNQAFKELNFKLDVVLNVVTFPPQVCGSPMGKWLKSRFPEHALLEDHMKMLDNPHGKYHYSNLGKQTHVCMCLPFAELIDGKEINLELKNVLSNIASDMRLSNKRSILIPYLGGTVMHLTYTEFTAMIASVFPSNEFNVFIFGSDKYDHLHTTGERINFGTFRSPKTEILREQRRTPYSMGKSVANSHQSPSKSMVARAS